MHITSLWNNLKAEGLRRADVNRSGFTLIELMMVMIIMAIAAMIVVPVVTGASGYQISSAARLVAADIEYARQLAITTGLVHSVVFDAAGESYQIQDNAGNVVSHPLRPGTDYIQHFPSSSLSKVTIQSVDFDGDATVKFDYLGSPLNSSDSSLNAGTVTLESQGHTAVIEVEPLTGYVNVQ